MTAPPGQAAGLSAAEAARRLARHGPNTLRDQPPPSAARLLLRQLEGPMLWLLLGACVVAAALGETADAIAIAAIVTLNALVGFAQELRSERALAALRAMTAPRARVRRDGRAAVIPAAEVVPGDLLLLEGGDLVAADARLTLAHALTVSEATLTGESVPVDKACGDEPADAPLAERRGSVFMGTAVAAGTGEAEVVATGMGTELGKIARLLDTVEREETPLQQRLAQVGRALVIMCLVVVAVVAALGALRGQPALDVLLSSVSLAVAAVPEGLAAIVTIALAVGVQRMASRHVLIRRLASVETLGCATVICTDKTGTLTAGVMALRETWGPDHRRVVATAAACCDAELGDGDGTGDDGGAGGVGDPTELAILAAARERGIERAAIEAATPRREVFPFDADRKRMAILRDDGVLYVKGAFEELAPRCDRAPPGAHEAATDLASRGLRVLAVAVGAGRDEADLELVGLLGLADPPRPEAVAAVADARRAGIHVVMITGDHPETAAAIAREMGVLRPGDDPAEIVHARATPEDKLRIVRRWKERGDVVAMTGDGVNDAPALREAHIGIAMGKSGTEVTREASDMVLTDDDFASIVAAVREGRGIYDNIRKTLVYLLTGNVGELLVMLVAISLGWPVPLLPMHLLWINLVTDGLPALALVMDPPEADTLARPPRPPKEAMLGRPEWRRIVLTAVVEAAVVLAVYRWALGRADGGVDEARSVVFSTIVFCEVLRAFGARSLTRIFWETGVLSNLLLLGVVAVTLGIQLALHAVPATQAFLRIDELPLADWALAIGAGLVPVTAVEVSKLLGRLRRRPA